MPVIVLLLFTTVEAFSARDNLTLKLEHPQTALDLRWDGKELKATDRFLSISIKAQACNQKLLSGFLRSEEEAWKDIPAQAPHPVRVTRNNESHRVSMHSELGKSLLSLRDKVRILSELSKKLCALGTGS